MDDESMNFVSIGSLLYNGVAVGAIATAVEQEGVHGWDRYGRFRRFDATSPEGAAALKALADQQAAIERDEQRPSELDELDSDFSRYGWLESDQPDFKRLAAGEVRVERPQSVAKERNAHLAIIGGLLTIIQGKGKTTPPHPSFESRAQLIELIRAEVGDYPGLSARNLSKKFKEADDVLAMR